MKFFVIFLMFFWGKFRDFSTNPIRAHPDAATPSEFNVHSRLKISVVEVMKFVVL